MIELCIRKLGASNAGTGNGRMQRSTKPHRTHWHERTLCTITKNRFLSTQPLPIPLCVGDDASSGHNSLYEKSVSQQKGMLLPH